MKLRNIGDWPLRWGGGAYDGRNHKFPEGEEGVFLQAICKVEAAPLEYPPQFPVHLNLRVKYLGQEFDVDYLLGDYVDHIDAVLGKLQSWIGRPVHEIGDQEIEFPEKLTCPLA